MRKDFCIPHNHFPLPMFIWEHAVNSLLWDRIYH